MLTARGIAVANHDHLAIVKAGADAIRAWQENSPTGSLDLRKANLSGAKLRSANLSGADLSGAKLSGAILSDADLISAKLIRADLSEANLISANLCKADLSGAKLSGAILSDADLSSAKLIRADLSEANLLQANLRSADLSGANLSGAQLSVVNLWHANLSGATVARARTAGTFFAATNLSAVQGLDTIHHMGPSTIGVDTLYLSRGKIPQDFLQGCGVPDGLITYLPSLISAQEGFLYYSCFISYSHADEAFANRLYARMREEHLRVWYAPKDMPPGRKIHEEIDNAIGVFDKLLLILSENSMKSAWVRTEIRKARKAEHESGKRKLFPIRLVDFDTIRKWESFYADKGEDLAEELREYLIPDFANWKKKKCFEEAFLRLFEALRVE
jgi:hypothetical protein